MQHGDTVEAAGTAGGPEAEESRVPLPEVIERFARGGEWKPRAVAEMVGWNRITVYRLVTEGKISAVRRGRRHMRVLGASVARYLEGLQELQ